MRQTVEFIVSAVILFLMVVVLWRLIAPAPVTTTLKEGSEAADTAATSTAHS